MEENLMNIFGFTCSNAFLTSCFKEDWTLVLLISILIGLLGVWFRRLLVIYSFSWDQLPFSSSIDLKNFWDLVLLWYFKSMIEYSRKLQLSWILQSMFSYCFTWFFDLKVIWMLPWSILMKFVNLFGINILHQK